MNASRSNPTLLAYRALGLGDLLTAVPALRALATAYPNHRRVLAAPGSLAPLALLAGVAHEVVDTNAFEPLEGVLHRRGITHIDIAVNLHGRGPQSHRVIRKLEPDRLVAFADPDGPRDSAAAPTWRDHEHEVHRWCRMLEAHGIAADAEDLDLDPPDSQFAAALGDDVIGATVIHAGAASMAREWPPERFAEVARAEREAGRAVVFTGSERERPLAECIAAAAGAPVGSVLAGRTGLLELAAVIGAASAIVCGDTGVAHLATAVRTPSVVLFGPTPPSEWGPPRNRPWHTALWAGDVGDPHAGSRDAGLLKIEVPDVLRALRTHVEPPAPRADDAQLVSVEGGWR